MRKAVNPQVPGEGSRHPRRVLWMAVVIAVAIVGSLLGYAALQPGPPLRILGVDVSPNPAVPDQPVTVTASVQGGTFLAPVSVMVEYNSFFTGGATGGGSLFSRGGGAYSTTIGPFPNGTTVWLVVVASDGGGFQVSDSYTVDVGVVPRGGPSGLRLVSVQLDPPKPTSLDQPVVTVNVTSAASLTDVSLHVMHFFASSGATASGGGGGLMESTGPGTYTSVSLFAVAGASSGITAVGTVWLYRIGATDSTGNTVLSPAYNFTVGSPTG